MTNLNYTLRTPLLTAIIVAVSSISGFATAAEVPVGTVISAANIDKIKNDTFERYTIASLLTEKIECGLEPVV